MSDSETLDLIKKEFSTREKVLRRAFETSESFRALCWDSRDCAKAASRWRASESEEARLRAAEYSELLAELTSEIEARLHAVGTLHGTKYVEHWPKLHTGRSAEDVFDWMAEGSVVKSLAISVMNDGDWGFSAVFPFFIVKNLETRLRGRFLVWRLYLKDVKLRDFGAMLTYAPSASRWLDSYLALGYE